MFSDVWSENAALFRRLMKIHSKSTNRPYAYDVTEGRPAALGVKRNTATCVIAKHAARGANPASHTAGLARPGPRTERLSANAQCQHNTCALRDTRLASLLWRCDPLWRQCIRSILYYGFKASQNAARFQGAFSVPHICIRVHFLHNINYSVSTFLLSWNDPSIFPALDLHILCAISIPLLEMSWTLFFLFCLSTEESHPFWKRWLIIFFAFCTPIP